MIATAERQDDITSQQWEWVRGMIAEIEQDERRENFARTFFQWDFAVREFRKVELRRIISAQPTDADRRSQAICLHHLLTAGHALVLWADSFTPDELKQFGISRSNVVAYVEELEASFREWHHGFTEAEIAAAQKSIFGGAA
jgi:hypothetical protein